MGSEPGEGKGADVQKQPSLNTLTRLGNEEVQKGDLQKALKYFQDAAEKAQKEHDSKVKISCCLNAGACLVSLSQHNKGLLFLEQAIAIIKNVEEDAQAAEVNGDVFYNAATAAYALKEFEKSVSYFTASIERYEKLGSKDHVAETLESLASCHRDMKDFEKQIACLVRAQQVYKETANSCGEALIDVELAKAYQSVRRFDLCKQTLGAAQVLSSKLDSLSVKGKLCTQLGLVYTSMGMFDDAVRSFEQALPLVRDVLVHEEASILQNMGAVYNEKGLYSDAIIYHKKAAALHGRNTNHNSEAKCLCNLAVAEIHLGDYVAAKTSYVNACRQAKAAGNLYLQFQASEGLGSLCIQTNHPKDAIHHLKQALKMLDDIKQDTGMARERVMEKLSDATEALRKDNPNHHRGTPISSEGSSSEEHPSGHRGNPEVHHLSLPAGPSSEECSSTLPNSSLQENGERNVTTNLSGKSAEYLPLPARKATALLPPIKSTKNTLAAAEGVDGSMATKTPLHKIATARKKRNKLGTVNEVPDAHEQLLNAYMDSIRNEENLASSSDTNLSGSEDHSDHLLGASVFSRHASKAHPRSQLSPAKSSLMNAGTTNSVPGSPLSVGEGSLAIGPNARERFTTGTTVIEKEHKRGKTRLQVQTEIVPVGGAQSCAQTLHPEGRGQVLQSGQSRVCLIL